jgi:hypothetical protein
VQHRLLGRLATRSPPTGGTCGRQAVGDRPPADPLDRWFAYERPSADSVNGSDNEEQSEHAISYSHDTRSVSLSRQRQLSPGGASNL